MRVVYTQSAIADIDHIAAYISERSSRGATVVLDAIETTVAAWGGFHYPLRPPTNRVSAWRPPGDIHT